MDERLKLLKFSMESTSVFSELVPNFLHHLESGYLQDFVKTNLEDIRQGRFRSRNLIIGQLQLNILTTANFQYKVRLLTSTTKDTNSIKWANKSIMARILGRGRLHAIRYRVPDECLSEQFRPDLKIQVQEKKVYQEGDIIISPDHGCYFEIERVDGAVCLEFIESSVLSDTNLLAWTFNKTTGSAIYCESASPLPSRLKVVTEIARHTGSKLDIGALTNLTDSKNSFIRKEAFCQLLVSDRDNILMHLEKALSDPSDDISEWAFAHMSRAIQPSIVAGVE